MGKKISVIVPVYNSAPYLTFCVESVLRQTWADFELLLIADGPTDGSEALCESLARRDGRIRFLPREHRGVSAARNAGLNQAEGEYVFFLDSDDAIHPRFLERLLELAERTGAVMTAGGLFGLPTGRFEESVTRLCASDGELRGEKTRCLNQQEALRRFWVKPTKEQMYSIGGKFIRRSAAVRIAFDESLPSGEDTKYLYEILAGGANVAVLYEDGYYYRERRESLSKERSVRACRSLYECYEYICACEKEAGREQSFFKWKEDILGKVASWHVVGHVRRDRALIQYTLELREENRAFIKKKQIDWRTRLGYFLAFHCCPAYLAARVVYDIWKKLREPEDDFCREP